jgi:hypothetical protein
MMFFQTVSITRKTFPAGALREPSVLVTVKLGMENSTALFVALAAGL